MILQEEYKIMIPKIVHYCWFGKKNKPAKIEKCISSWKKILSDYDFIEWNENNYNVFSNAYVSEAYLNKKYAFVSDVARIEALVKYGGIYLDTDVEVIKKFDDILEHQCVFGFEYKNWIATSFMASEPNHPIMKRFQSAYENINFVKGQNGFDMQTNVVRITNLLIELGLKQDNAYQELVQGIVIYPKEFFSPYDYGNCVLEKTDNSICIHYFYVSWLPWHEKVKKIIKHILVMFLGKRGLVNIRNIIKGQNELE